MPWNDLLARTIWLIAGLVLLAGRIREELGDSGRKRAGNGLRPAGRLEAAGQAIGCPSRGRRIAIPLFRGNNSADRRRTVAGTPSR